MTFFRKSNKVKSSHLTLIDTALPDINNVLTTEMGQLDDKLHDVANQLEIEPFNEPDQNPKQVTIDAIFIIVRFWLCSMNLDQSWTK